MGSATPVIVQPTLVPESESRAIAKIQPAGEWAEMFERLAANPQVDVSKLSALMDLRDRVISQDAAREFTRAFATMQGELPVIAEKASTDKGKYAPLEDIVEKVRPILKSHGFSLSHRTEWLQDWKLVKVIGVLAHVGGHERTSEFVSAADTSGSKNAIQALGSAMSYGRRYTTNDLLGIVTRNEDTDGKGAAPTGAPLPPGGFDDWWEDMDSVSKHGSLPLEKAWNESKGVFKAYVTRYLSEKWADMKKRASKVKAQE